ncbi:MAG TPA: hypothetical protein VF887_06635, partial [Gemmatimonadaceae bacterium]
MPDAFALDFAVDLTGCFFAAGFMVGFFVAGFFAAVCLAAALAGCAIGADACRTGTEWDGSGRMAFAAGADDGVDGFRLACEAST